MQVGNKAGNTPSHCLVLPPPPSLSCTAQDEHQNHRIICPPLWNMVTAVGTMGKVTVGQYRVAPTSTVWGGRGTGSVLEQGGQRTGGGQVCVVGKGMACV